MLVNMSREDAEKHPMMKWRNVVNGSLNRLDSLEREVNEILEEGDQEIQKRCLRNFCSSNCRSSYNIGRRIKSLKKKNKENEHNEI